MGYNADEKERSENALYQFFKRGPGFKPNEAFRVEFPLVEFGITGHDAKEHCHNMGFHWEHHYDTFESLFCRFCPLRPDYKFGDYQKIFRQDKKSWDALVTKDAEYMEKHTKGLLCRMPLFRNESKLTVKDLDHAFRLVEPEKHS